MVKGIFHTSITVKNREKAINFYRDVLGLKLLFVKETSGESISNGVGVKNSSLKIAMFQASNEYLELIEYVTPKCKPLGLRPCDIGSMHIAFLVDDIYEIEKRINAVGCHFNQPPKLIEKGEMKGWLWAYFKDPDGALLEVVELKS